MCAEGVAIDARKREGHRRTAEEVEPRCAVAASVVRFELPRPAIPLTLADTPSAFPHRVFWILPMTQLFQAEATGAFSGSATDLITKKGYKEEVAAFYANARSIIPILMAPVVGLGVDRFGHRFHLTAAAPLFFIIAFVVMGWTNVNPLAAVVIFSLGSVINYMP